MYGAHVRESFLPRPGGGMTLVEVQSDSPAVHEYFGTAPGPEGKAQARRDLDEARLLSMGYQDHRLLAGEERLVLGELAAPGQVLRLLVTQEPKP